MPTKQRLNDTSSSMTDRRKLIRDIRNFVARGEQLLIALERDSAFTGDDDSSRAVARSTKAVH